MYISTVMEQYSNAFTQWCESNGLTDAACPSASVMKAVEYLLNDAAGQSQGSSFDSSRVTAAKLNTKNKPELIKMIQNYAWFSHMVVLPYVVEVDAESYKETTRNLEEAEQKLEEVTAKINSMQDTVIKAQDALLTVVLRHICHPATPFAIPNSWHS